MNVQVPKLAFLNIDFIIPLPNHPRIKLLVIPPQPVRKQDPDLIPGEGQPPSRCRSALLCNRQSISIRVIGKQETRTGA